jgi:uncharacterized membrane protein
MQRLRQLLRNLFPPPRRAVRAGDALSLVLFFLLFAAACVGLEFGGVLMFARPAAFGLAVFAAWIWWLHVAGYAGLPKVRGHVALWTRFLLFALLVMVLAEPRSVRSRDVLSVMYLVDVSDSVRGDSVDASIRYVLEAVAKKPTKDEAGLLVFGKTPAVELPPRMSFPYEAMNSQVDRGSTNVEQSLSLAGAMLPDDNQGRLVVISDGVQTEGNLTRVLDDLKSRGIPVDVLPVDYSYDKEVWLERIDLPQQVKPGETYEAAMVLSSLEAGEGKLTLRENGQIVAEQTVQFQAGKNRYVVPITLRAAGYYEYTASIEVDRSTDSLPQNNTVLGYIFVEGEGQVLLVTDSPGDARDWERLQAALVAAERAVKVIPAYDFPTDTAALMPYDCIIFCNVPFDAFDFGQLQGLKEAVYNVGIGFLMVGGQNSFGPGGWHRTVVEEILPVTMDISEKKVLPKGALAIILHSCEFPEGNTWAKRITKQAIKVLSAKDEVGVLAYTSTGENWIFDLTPAGEYERLTPLIDGAQIGDMPSFQNTMQLGLASLLKSDAATKHMIIISDGDPSPATDALLDLYVAAKISVSTVAVFPHGGMEQQTLELIAGYTNGRYYFVNENPDVLPSIFIKESKTLKRSMIQNKVFSPQLGFPSPVLKGIDALPDLKGYVITNAKPSPAMTLLNAPPDEQDPTQQDPVLAIWQHGLGKTAAFTSDLSPNWAGGWQEWNHYDPFVKQLLIDISRVHQAGSLRMSTYTSGGEAVIVAEDFFPSDSFLEVSAKVSGPGGKSETVRLKQVAPRRYQANVGLWSHGRYHVSAQGKGTGRDETAFGGFIVPYSPEYLRFRSNRQTLTDIASRTGGRVLTGQPLEDDVFHVDRAPKRSTKPVFDWFLIALACLVPIDVAVRRIQIDFKGLLSLLSFRRTGPATATTGALLQRKQEVQSTMQSRKDERPLPPPSFKPTAPRPAPPRPTAPPPPSAPPVGDEKPMSTTERLLKLKQQREDPPDEQK